MLLHCNRFIWNNRAISTQSSTQKAIVINRKWAIVLIVLTHAGETPLDYISAIYRMTGNIKALCSKQWTVQLMLSWWTNLISCRVDYQCLVLTNIVALVGVIHTRGQYIRSHSTREDFISLIVAVFLNTEVWSPWLSSQKADRCRVHLDIRRKRPRCWSTLTSTFFGKDFTQSS